MAPHGPLGSFLAVKNNAVMNTFLSLLSCSLKIFPKVEFLVKRVYLGSFILLKLIILETGSWQS